MSTRSTIAALVVAGCMVGAVRSAPVAWADGFHGAAMTTTSLDDWMRDLKTQVPQIGEQLSTADLKAGVGAEGLKKKLEELKNKPVQAAEKKKRPDGGKMYAELTPQQKALLERKAADALEVLAYLDRGNIYPAEFPDFPVEKINDYRAVAKELLEAMGPGGTSAIVNRIRSELMGGANAPFDVKLHPDFYKDMLSSLQSAASNGGATADDLKAMFEAGAGAKNPQTIAFATQAAQILLDNATLDALITAAKDEPNSIIRRKLNQAAQKRLGEAPLDQLLEASQSTTDAALKQQLQTKIDARMAMAEAPELTRMLLDLQDDALRGKAAGHLSQRSPTYKEMADSIELLQELSRSIDPAVKQAAQGQLANAFQRAPIGETLRWAGSGDPALKELIFTQIDGRIARADDPRKAGYRDVGLETLADRDQPAGVRQASLELLNRLNDRQTAAKLLELLPQLPRDDWPSVGAALRKITGQTFGPRPGDGAAELTVELKKWRDWLSAPP